LVFRFTARPAARVLAVGLALGASAGLALGSVYAALAPNAPPTPTTPMRGPIAAPPLAAVAIGLRPALPAPGPAGDAPRIEAVVQHAVPRAAGDLDCLADAVYYEARGESAEGQAAIAQVVLNRTRHAGFPKSVCGVVFQGAAAGACQFSFACNGLMDRKKEVEAWARARVVAQRALSGITAPEVGQATHFHIASVHPGWGPNLIRVAQVGVHVFYRLSGAASVGAPAKADAPRVMLASMIPGLGEPVPAPPPAPAQPVSAVAATTKAEPAVAVVASPAAVLPAATPKDAARPATKPATPEAVPAPKPAEVAAS
jgi:hypothetical protein